MISYIIQYFCIYFFFSVHRFYSVTAIILKSTNSQMEQKVQSNWPTHKLYVFNQRNLRFIIGNYVYVWILTATYKQMQRWSVILSKSLTIRNIFLKITLNWYSFWLILGKYRSHAQYSLWISTLSKCALSLSLFLYFSVFCFQFHKILMLVRVAHRAYVFDIHNLRDIINALTLWNKLMRWKAIWKESKEEKHKNIIPQK